MLIKKETFGIVLVYPLGSLDLLAQNKEFVLLRRKLCPSVVTLHDHVVSRELAKVAFAHQADFIE